MDLTNPEDVKRTLESTRPRVVVNLAGMRARASEDPRAVFVLNAEAAIGLVVASQAAGVERIVLVGSAEEYGKQPMPVSETAALNPLSAYGESKARMSCSALDLFAKMKAPVTIVRPFSVYGPGASTAMFVGEAVDCVVRGVPFSMTDGGQKRDFIHVSDVADGIVAAATAPGVEGEVFNLGSGESRSMRSVAETLWTISGTAAALRIGAKARGATDLEETRANIDKANRLLGWSPRIGFEEGLLSTWRSARERA